MATGVGWLELRGRKASQSDPTTEQDGLEGQP